MVENPMRIQFVIEFSCSYKFNEKKIENLPVFFIQIVWRRGAVPKKVWMQSGVEYLSCRAVPYGDISMGGIVKNSGMQIKLNSQARAVTVRAVFIIISPIKCR